MLRDVRNYTASLNFNIGISVDRGQLHSVSSRGGVSPSGGDTPKEPVPTFSQSPSLILKPTSPSASTLTFSPAPAQPKATTGLTCHYVVSSGVTPAVTHSQAPRQTQTPAICGNQGNSCNTSAAITERFRPDTLNHLHELELFSTEVHDIAHQMDYRATFSAEYTYMPRQICRKALCKGEEISNAKHLQEGDDSSESSVYEGSRR